MPRPQTDRALVRRQMLAALDALVRKHGAARLTVSDVARACGMSQSNAYRFFPNKKALIEARVALWFEDVEAELAAIAAAGGVPEEQLTRFLFRRYELKRAKFDADPVLFAAHLELSKLATEPIAVHLRRMQALLEEIVARGLDAGLFPPSSPGKMADIIEILSDGFSNPFVILKEHERLGPDQVKAAIDVLLAGLKRTPA